MKLCKRMIPALLAVLMLSTTVLAAGRIDLDREAALTISYQDGSAPLSGAEFRIYLVASVDETGELTPTDDFDSFQVDIRGKNDEAWRALASTLEGYVLRDGVAPADSGKTDADGQLHFPTDGRKLTPGLYLVLGSRHTQGGQRYDPMPFMVMLPTQNTERNAWVYDVLVSPKFEASAVPDTPSAITRKVLKVWDDAGSEKDRPTEVTVQLLRDGAVYDTVTLSAGNGWSHTWSGLDDGCTWTVVEKECEGYTVRVEREGITFVMTNTYAAEIPDNPTPEAPLPPDPAKPTPGGPTLPQTGQVWWPVPFLLMTGLLLLAVGLFRRRTTGDER